VTSGLEFIYKCTVIINNRINNKTMIGAQRAGSHLYTLAEGIIISVRSLQRSEGDVSDPIKYIYS